MTTATNSPAVTAVRAGNFCKVVNPQKLETIRRLASYKSLTRVITDYQIGKGPAPTDEQFNQWLVDLEHAVELKTMMIKG